MTLSGALAALRQGKQGLRSRWPLVMRNPDKYVEIFGKVG